MRALLIITVVLMAGWSGYWLVGKSAVDRAFTAFVAAAPSRGLEVSHQGYSIAGFPNRFDLTVTEPRLRDAVSTLAWQAPFVQVFSLSYTPWHVIAAFAPQQTLSTPRQSIDVTSGKLQASVVVTPGTALTLDRTTLVGDSIAARSNIGWSLAADQLRFATRQDPSQTNTHHIGLEVVNLTPDRSLTDLMPELPDQVALTRLDARVTLSAPLDRFAASTRPQPTALSLREALVQWGGLSIFASGDLNVVDSRPEGRLQIRVTGWRNLVTLAVALGLIKPEVAPTAGNMLAALAASSGDAGTLDLPLIFAAGRMSLGPLPLGPAPRLN